LVPGPVVTSELFGGPPKSPPTPVLTIAPLPAAFCTSKTPARGRGLLPLDAALQATSNAQDKEKPDSTR
jgi:hypothetical protein